MVREKNYHVKVAVRVRPMMVHDKQQDVVVQTSREGGANFITVLDPDKAFAGKKQEIDYLRVDYLRERQYEFDHVYGPGDNTERVFEEAVSPLLNSVFDGMNVTIFAYGQTGSGKTHTMLGHRGEVGVMRLTLEHLFRGASGQSKSRFVCSFVELYNEEIRDLLTTGPQRVHVDHGGVGGLELREDPAKGPTIVGVTEVSASDVETVMGLLQQGNSRRTQESTRANAESSRSHAVLQIAVESRDRLPPANKKAVPSKQQKLVRVKRSSKLSMIDLAGSERAAETENRGARLQEGARINRSLLALGNVINALREAKGKGSAKPYVNFRDSKLTRLLKDSLGGNCRTLMLAHASPAASSFEETLNTLKYAHRARCIKNSVRENIRKVAPPPRPPAREQAEPHERRAPSGRAEQQRRRPHKAPSRDLAPPSRGEDALERRGRRHAGVVEQPPVAPRMTDLKSKLRSRARPHRAAVKQPHALRSSASAVLATATAHAATAHAHEQREQLHRTRQEVISHVREAIELRNNIEQIIHTGTTHLQSSSREQQQQQQQQQSQQSEQRSSSTGSRDPEEGVVLPEIAARQRLRRADEELLQRDPLGYLSNLLMEQTVTNKAATNQDDSPSPSSHKDARARSRAQRECEGLRRAVKRNLEKQRDVISALGATSNQRPAVKRELLDLLDASKDEQNALLDAEMRVVGLELERLELAEAANPEVDAAGVHELALQKLELQVKLRNNVIRKLVQELEKRQHETGPRRERGRDARSLADVTRPNERGRSRPQSAQESARARVFCKSGRGEASRVFAEIIQDRDFLQDLPTAYKLRLAETNGADDDSLPHLPNLRAQEGADIRWRR